MPFVPGQPNGSCSTDFCCKNNSWNHTFILFQIGEPFVWRLLCGGMFRAAEQRWGGEKRERKRSQTDFFFPLVLFSVKISPRPRQMKTPAPDIVTFCLLGPRVSSQIIFKNCLISELLFPPVNKWYLKFQGGFRC